MRSGAAQGEDGIDAGGKRDRSDFYEIRSGASREIRRVLSRFTCPGTSQSLDRRISLAFLFSIGYLRMTIAAAQLRLSGGASKVFPPPATCCTGPHSPEAISIQWAANGPFAAEKSTRTSPPAGKYKA